ncbi:TIGR02300 family protein [Devosia sp. MC532]|uniref:TIGR02300 family protein n=1 Tax=Devosia sp. MC532 TaxID=2799788 RepID=UPI0018F5F8F3|nr:TIGR02300 family protein [Devosia sp. MC532]MBJ7577290.1 TIGR02300 family protein [Devosia sp. MC532]
MANSERGTKRTDPDTGKKFYDLNQDPIVSPYTGKSYPRSFFEQLTGKAGPATARKADDEDELEDEDEVEDTGPEIVSLEDADAEESGDEIPDVEDVEVEEDLGDDEEDVFLEEDEDEDDGLGFDVGSDEER